MKLKITKGFTALFIVAVIGIASCSDSATTETPKADSPMVAPADNMAPPPPPTMDTMPKSDTGRDTKVPRN